MVEDDRLRVNKSPRQAGWGAVFALDTDPAIRQALEPLLALRREQAGDLFRLMEHLPGETATNFLRRHKVTSGPADSKWMPYYLLLVGDSEAISLTFQSQLDGRFAVGRLHFETVADYASYAASVVRAENEPRAVGSGVEPFDLRRAELSAEMGDLIFGDPAAQWIARPASESSRSDDMDSYSVPAPMPPRPATASVSAAEVSLPEVSLPEVSLPEVSLPEVSLSEVSLSEVSLSTVEEAETVDEEPAPTDAGDVRFSAYHPRCLRIGETRPLLVYIHLLEQEASVGVDAGQVLGKSAEEFARSESESCLAIPLNTEIRVVPRARGLAFDPPEASMTWDGNWRRSDFAMSATGERRGHVIEGSVACYVGPILIADIRLPVVVPRIAADEARASAEADTLEVRTTEMYKAIFASYSHADTAIVEEVEKVCEALGMDYLRDVMDLRAGQDWSEELLRMIDKADVFQLFWSRTASDSAYVEQEWRHALDLVDEKGSTFIRPIYWHKPMPAVPPALGHIHFAPAAFVESVPPAHSPLVGAVSEDLEPLTVTTHGESEVRSRISMTGEVETHVGQGSDRALLELHGRMVTEAVKVRLAYLASDLK